MSIEMFIKNLIVLVSILIISGCEGNRHNLKEKSTLIDCIEFIMYSNLANYDILENSIKYPLNSTDSSAMEVISELHKLSKNHYRNIQLIDSIVVITDTSLFWNLESNLKQIIIEENISKNHKIFSRMLEFKNNFKTSGDQIYLILYVLNLGLLEEYVFLEIVGRLESTSE